MSNTYHKINFLRSSRINPLDPNADPSRKPLCSETVPYYNVNRLPILGLNDCKNAQEDLGMTSKPSEGGLTKEEARSLCSLYYNNPWVGEPKICNGEPKLIDRWLDDWGYWECQAGSECRMPDP